MSKIIFFQHYHNGDLFACKEYVRNIKNLLPNIEFEYQHKNHQDALLDLKIKQEYLKLTDEYQNKKFIEENSQTLYINTWTGAFPNKNTKFGPNPIGIKIMFTEIFNKINEFFKCNITVNPDLNYYTPTIEYSNFYLEKINNFLKNSNKKILISNGSPKSGQSFDWNMEEIINELAVKYKNILFICTEKIYSKYSNVLFTEDIIKKEKNTNLTNSWNKNYCDLNEISYLSLYCDLIIGKNSGPYIYCMVKENIYNSKKIILSFNSKERDSLLYGINHLCDYEYNAVSDKNYSKFEIKNIIEKKILCM